MTKLITWVEEIITWAIKRWLTEKVEEEPLGQWVDLGPCCVNLTAGRYFQTVPATAQIWVGGGNLLVSDLILYVDKKDRFGKI